MPTPASARFAFLRWPLDPLPESVTRSPVDPLLEDHLSKARFSVRLLRYWWGAQAIREEARRRGQRITVVDYGSGRGWLKRFVGEDIDAHWIALDWQPQRTLLEKAGYHEIHECNFDQPLPVPDGAADVVSALHVFEHLPRPARSLTEIERILGPEGCLLAGTPTMPSPLARWRQASFRRQLEQGHIARGGHINCLSPDRWRSLLEDTGLRTEFLTGSHLVRHTGNPLENSRAWIRLNHLWGAMFPSLGSEACLRARKPPALAAEVAEWRPQALTGSKKRPRLAVAAGLVSLIVAVSSGCLLARERLQAHVNRVLTAQLEIDAEHFLIVHHDLLSEFENHAHATIIDHPSGIAAGLERLPPGTHVVLHEDHLHALGSSVEQYVIDSRIDVSDHDFYLIRRGEDGTPLDHFLSRQRSP